MTRVDVIVPTYNSPALLSTCLSHLKHSTFRDYRLIVVDDGSNEPVVEIVRRHHAGATVLRAESNRGLVRGVNAGIRAGRSEYVALLNDDTEVTPRWLESLVTAAGKHPQAGSIASKIMLASDRRLFHSAGDTFSVRGMAGNRGVWLDDLGQYDRAEEVFGVCAGAALYRRSALEDVKLRAGDYFDRRLFMYLEDVDLAWRLQMAGYRAVYTPEAIVYHHLSATAGGRLASYYVNRNRLLILRRTVPAAFFRNRRTRIFLAQLGVFVGHLHHAREPAARSAMRGFAAGLLGAIATSAGRGEPDPLELDRIECLLVD